MSIVKCGISKAGRDRYTHVASVYRIHAMSTDTNVHIKAYYNLYTTHVINSFKNTLYRYRGFLNDFVDSFEKS